MTFDSFELLENELIDWDKFLVSRQKKYIHYRSVRNFIFHYDSLPNPIIKQTVSNLLEGYIIEVQENLYNFSQGESYGLMAKYINPLSEYYETYLGFKSYLEFKWALIFGVLIDTVAFFLLKAYGFTYYPLALPILLCYSLYLTIKFSKKKKVFGLFY